jgi:hypothetical protein
LRSGTQQNCWNRRSIGLFHRYPETSRGEQVRTATGRDPITANDYAFHAG